jgi:hypothetical protein
MKRETGPRAQCTHYETTVYLLNEQAVIGSLPMMLSLGYVLNRQESKTSTLANAPTAVVGFGQYFQNVGFHSQAKK